MAGLEGAPLAPSLCAWPLGPCVAGQEGALAEPSLLWGGWDDLPFCPSLLLASSGISPIDLFPWHVWAAAGSYPEM